MPRTEEYDWIFDYVLQFLESDKFDAAIMDFVDEKCFVFEDEEENKLIYTDIHKEFVDHVEALISSNLGELGISNEMFLDSCERARSDRDINATVFERLVAMDDFQTFKKIMTKRNTELQLEAIRSLRLAAKKSEKIATPKKSDFKHDTTTDSDEEDDGGYGDQLMDPDELLAMKEADLADLAEFDRMQEDELQELLMQSFMEMEFMHRQEELEHAELERALMLSLAAEEERIRALVSEMKLTPDEGTPVSYSDAKHATPAESKGNTASASSHSTSKAAVVADDDDAAQYTQTLAAESTTSISTAAESKSTTRSSPKKMKPVQPSAAFANLSADAFADVKPLKMREMKPLPSLPSLNKQPAPEQLVQDLLDKKKLTESIVKKGAEQLQSQRANEESFKQQLSDKSAIDKEELERRGKHLQAQRDLLIAKKKAEREEKVRVEEERKRKGDNDNESKNSSPVKKKNPFLDAKRAEVEEEDNTEEIAEMRRATMRMALARRLKLDLIESEEAKMNALQESQFLELDKKLQQVEQLREDNRKREYILQKQMERQQDQIARNMELSAAQMARNRDL